MFYLHSTVNNFHWWKRLQSFGLYHNHLEIKQQQSSDGFKTKVADKYCKCLLLGDSNIKQIYTLRIKSCGMFRPYPNNLTASDWKIFTKGQIKIGAQEWNFRGILFVSKPFDIQKQYSFDSFKENFEMLSLQFISKNFIFLLSYHICITIINFYSFPLVSMQSMQL